MQNGGLSQIWSSKSLTLTFMSKYSVALMQKKWNKKEILTQINLALISFISSYLSLSALILVLSYLEALWDRGKVWYEILEIKAFGLFF